MRTIKIYDVKMGCTDARDGSDMGNWSRIRVMAKSADEAIKRQESNWEMVSTREK